MVASSIPCDHETKDTMPVQWKRLSKPQEADTPSSHAPIRAERSTLYSRAPPLSRNETIGDRLNRPPDRNEAVRPRDGTPSRPLWQWPLNRETLSDRLAPLPVPQRTADHPEQPIERGEQDDEARPEENDARIDDEPFHHETHGTSASVTTARKPIPRPHTARIVERARERNAIAESHFDLTFQVG